MKLNDRLFQCLFAECAKKSIIPSFVMMKMKVQTIVMVSKQSHMFSKLLLKLELLLKIEVVKFYFHTIHFTFP